MIQVYADGNIVYDSRVEETALIELTATLAINKSGTLALKMPRNHPAHNAFTPRRTLVEVYRDDVLFFRGRVLYETDDFLLNRTITCEGERGFFQDALMRPYKYQAAPAHIFAEIIGIYNNQVDEFKKFTVGTVDVTAVNANGAPDGSTQIIFESEDAESFAETLEKLVERCGGYITFSTDDNTGEREINWTSELNAQSDQVIEYGENLLDFTRTGASTDIFSRVIPFGAKNSAGERLTIKSSDYNEGRDYIQDDTLVNRFGIISRAIYWDDITDSNRLYHKAAQYLYASRNRASSLELTAFDLSLIDHSIDRFHLGDRVRVKSAPHDVDAYYRLDEQTIDFLRPQNDKVVLGGGTSTLTGGGAAGSRKNTASIQTLEKIVRADTTINQPAIVEETKLALASLIQQASDAIMLEVSEQFATNGDVENVIQTTMTQLADSFEFLFYQLETRVDSNDIQARTQFEEIAKYIRFVDGNIILGEQGNEITLRIENDRLSFLDDGAEVAYFSNKKLTVLDGSFLNSLQIGKFKFLPRENGNLSLVKIGG